MKKVMIFLLLLGIFLYGVGYASAGISSWHKPISCFGCHEGGIGASLGSGECGGCHNYKLNTSKLEEKHDPKICKVCHIGNTIVNGTKTEIFHNGHRTVDCAKCHVQDNTTIIRPQNESFECMSCHGNQIHSIHIENLGNACPTCHGSWAKDKVYKKEGSVDIADNESTNTELGRFTIFNFLKNFFNAILGNNKDNENSVK